MAFESKNFVPPCEVMKLSPLEEGDEEEEEENEYDDDDEEADENDE